MFDDNDNRKKIKFWVGFFALFSIAPFAVTEFTSLAKIVIFISCISIIFMIIWADKHINKRWFWDNVPAKPIITGRQRKRVTR